MRSARHLAGAAAAWLLIGVVTVGCGTDGDDDGAGRASDATTTAEPGAGPASTSEPAVGPGSTSEPAIPDSPTSTPSSAPATSSEPPSARSCLADVPLETLVGQLVWPSVDGGDLTQLASTYADWGVGGVVLMTWPEGATAEDLAAFATAGAIPLAIAVDEEGGDVQRLRRLGRLPSAAAVASTMTPAAAGEMVEAHARQVRALGVDVVFAPVVDVSPLTGRGPLGQRAFSTDPAVVTDYGSAYVDAWTRAGVLPVLKHFPGHGAATGDTHDELARTVPLDELWGRDLAPYRALVDSGAGVMVGHLDVPELTEGLPASLSPDAITELLRGEMGYSDRLVFTDALDMGAISASMEVPESAELAIGAGADVAIFTSPSEAPAVVDRLVEAVSAGRLSVERVFDAARRVLALKGVDPCGLVE